MGQTQIVIDSLKDSDQESVRQLILSIVETELSEVPPEDYMSDLENIHTSYSGHQEGFWVARDGGEVIGTIAVKDDGGDAMIRRFFVNPHYRSRGVGKSLINRAIRHCRESGFKEIYFVGNSKLHKVRRAMIYFGFRELEEIFLGGVSIFKLRYLI